MRLPPTLSASPLAPLLAALVLATGPGLLQAAAAEPSTPDPAAAALEQLRAANHARADLAQAEAAWTAERQRLQAVIDATSAETARLEGEAASAEQVRDAARARLAALGSGSDLDAMRARLAEAGDREGAALTALSRQLPPGAVAAVAASGTDASFDAVVRALESAEHAAGAVAIEVVSGERDGRREAVKMLRVAGAAAWWVALDGTAAGVVEVRDGALRLLDCAALRRDLIIAALAQAEGRGQPAIALLPAPAAVSGAQP